MGVDLRLLPFDGSIGDSAFSHTALECERRRELFPRIEKLPSLPVPDGFTSFSGTVPDGKNKGETGYGVTNETPYGGRLQYTIVEQLLTLSKHEGVTDNFRNRAIWAYLKELPLQTRVALYWH